jgi:hypothetical protein
VEGVGEAREGDGKTQLVLGRYTARGVAHCDIWSVGFGVRWLWRAEDSPHAYGNLNGEA